MSLNENQLAILKAISNNQTSEKEISKAVGLELYQVRYYLEEMKKEKFVKYTTSPDGLGEPSYSDCWLTDQGKVAATNPNALIRKDSGRNINTGGGNYNEHIAGNYYQQSGNLGVGHISGGKIKDNVKIVGNLNEAEQQNLVQAAAEIQQLLEQLEKSYPINTNADKMRVAAEAISQIESNPNLMARILSALKAGSVSAFEQLLNHPVASFVIAALEDWQETKDR